MDKYYFSILVCPFDNYIFNRIFFISSKIITFSYS
nr:MAG TPA: hypothetical protein [Caudoviricetes sp.]